MTVSRELSIIYGSVTTGGASAATYNIDGWYSLSFERGLDSITATLAWDVIVKGSSASNLESNCDTLEQEFVKPYLRARVLLDGATGVDWNPSDDSGFNAQPKCEKVGGPPDSARARKYRCSVAVQLPADNNNGRINSNVSVDFSKSDLRTVSFNATYTAQGGTGAYDNAQAKFGTFCSSILSSLGGTYEILGTGTFDFDDQDKICNARAQYKEILYNQSSGGADQSAVVDHEVNFNLSEVAPGDTPGGPYGEARRLATITATYSCNVDFGVQTDLNSLWKNTLRPYLIQQARTIFQANIVAVTENGPSFNKSENTINCNLRMSAVIQGATVFQYSVTQTRNENPGPTIIPVYDGNRYAKYVYEDIAETTRTTTINAVFSDIRGIQRIKGIRLAEGERQADGRVDFGETEGWVRTESQPTFRPVRMGLPGLTGFVDMTEYTQIIKESWVEAPSSSGGRYGRSPVRPSAGGGGSGSPATTPR